jgi:hypothetical protein
MSNTKCFKIIDNTDKVKETCLTQKESNNIALQNNNLTAMKNDDCVNTCSNYNKFQKKLKKQTSDSKILHKN